MRSYEQEKRLRETALLNHQVKTALEDAGVRTPDVATDTYLKWDRPDGGYVIFRAHYTGSFGTLDVRWRDEDGALNGTWAPKDYTYLDWIVRDVGIMLQDGPRTREEVARMGKG